MGKCYNSAVVAAPCEKVWQNIRNFHDLSWAPGVVTKVDVEGGLKGDQIGAKRIVNDAFHETLLTLDDAEHTFSYSIDDGPEPVSKESVKNYVGTVRVAPITESDTTFIEWQSTYESSDDSAVGDFCNPIYVALLSALKQHFASISSSGGARV
ncbi:MAG: SRPBCC family protein [Phycisphaerales bacterium]|nr:MAG: SRPBCC family protein [Phycisphaerales bacterium]